MAICNICAVEVNGRFCANCGQTLEAVSEIVLSPASAVTVDAYPNRTVLADQTRHAGLRPPGYVPPAMLPPAPGIGSTDTNCFTPAASAILQSTGELIAWQGKPSPLYLLPRAIAWSLILMTAVSWAAASGRGWWWVLLWTLAACINLGKRFLAWKHTLYRITSQRLEVSRGVLSQTVDTVPLIEINQVRIHKPFPWSLLGLGDLLLDVADPSYGSSRGSGANLRLWGLRDLTSVRDLIHSSSNFGGQLWDERRFGRSGD